MDSTRAPPSLAVRDPRSLETNKDWYRKQGFRQLSGKTLGHSTRITCVFIYIYIISILFTIWLFNIAMENPPIL